MPYRRLPTTDKARLRALVKCHEKTKGNMPGIQPISEATLASLKTLLPRFQQAIINLDAAKNNQVEKNKNYIELQRKARIYVSHFIQVVNMAIARGELKPEIREFYGLSDFGSTLPPLNAEKELIDWGKQIIDGDQKRIQHGGSPIYNPSIALVRVNYEKYLDVYHFQKTLQSTTERSSNQVNQLRSDVDKLIQTIWNEIEEHFEALPDSTKREKCASFGIVYVYRKSEKKKIEARKLQPEFNF